MVNSATPVIASQQSEMILTIGLFFDGSGNNAANVACAQQDYPLDMIGSDENIQPALMRNIRQGYRAAGVFSSSYNNDYTNIWHLYQLYQLNPEPQTRQLQHAVYIEGIGTENGKADSLIGLALGIGDSGIVAKTDKAVARLAQEIGLALEKVKQKFPFSGIKLEFDLFGFSRGAAAARHFANRIMEQDAQIRNAISSGFAHMNYTGSPAGSIRFIGLFDCVTAVANLADKFNPHDVNNAEVKLALPAHIAQQVFHITAQHECRFNFALNSVYPLWSELSLPGVHADIGGGYIARKEENVFLTKPRFSFIEEDEDDNKTNAYQKTSADFSALKNFPAIAPFITSAGLETWHYLLAKGRQRHTARKRTGAALTLRNHTVYNDWAKVTMQVMMEAAQQSGVRFQPVSEQKLIIPAELVGLCTKAISAGQEILRDKSLRKPVFNRNEIHIIEQKYIHCSANWNAPEMNKKGEITTTGKISDIAFINRPDKNWVRTLYDMEGNRLEQPYPR